MKENVAREFLSRLRHQSRLDALDWCFPLSMLGLEASATEFIHIDLWDDYLDPA